MSVSSPLESLHGERECLLSSSMMRLGGCREAAVWRSAASVCSVCVRASGTARHLRATRAPAHQIINFFGGRGGAVWPASLERGTDRV